MSEPTVWQSLPPTAPGLRVGLLGGSFDPPHSGHVHITHWAIKRFRLDRVWWLVSPGNPLKNRAPVDLNRRIAACRTLMRHPRVTVTDIERILGTQYTADTIRMLSMYKPDLRFVWLMGADNLAGFHRWDDWTGIMSTTPIGVLGRPGDQLKAGLSPTAQRFARARLRGRQAPVLALTKAPAWVLLSGPMLDISSTQIRQAGAWS